MQNKKKRIVKIFSESAGQCWNSTQLAELLRTSQRTVLRYIKELKEDEEAGGFRLNSYKGKGYEFEVLDSEKLEAYLEDDESVRIVLLKILLGDNCKLDDLAEMFNYSRSGMTGIVSAVTEELEQHGLRLISRPYVGFSVYGNEIYIRNYLYQLLKKTKLAEADEILRMPADQSRAVRDKISDYLEERNVCRKLEKEEFFLKYLGIQLCRIRQGQTVCTGFFHNLDAESHFQDDLRIAKSVLGLCGIAEENTGNYEIEAVYLALVYRQAFWQNGFVDKVDERDLGFYQEMVENAMKRIQKNYHIDPLEDEILVNGLILHIASSYRKYLLGMETENFFHNTMLENYPTAYYYAMEVAEEISGYTGLPLSKYEVSFLGMHFASYLERNLQSNSFRVAIICMSGMETAQLLKSRLQNFYSHLEIVGVYPLGEWEEKIEDVDFLITTVPLDTEAARGKAWVQVSPLLPLEEQIAIEKIFKRLGKARRWEKDGVPKYFGYMSGRRQKQEIIDLVCNKYIKEGMISEEEKAGILERERMVSTEILDGVAMPHGLIQNESFLTFIMLENPVMWGRTKVKLVILGCFQRGDNRMKEELEHIFRMLLDEGTKQELLACETTLQLEEKINEYYKE